MEAVLSATIAPEAQDEGQLAELDQLARRQPLVLPPGVQPLPTLERQGCGVRRHLFLHHSQLPAHHRAHVEIVEAGVDDTRSTSPAGYQPERQGDLRKGQGASFFFCKADQTTAAIVITAPTA